MAKPLSKSKRQYVHVNNGPAQRLARKIPGVKPAPMPDYIEPLLATEGQPPRGGNWLHEIKYDGYRFQLHVKNGQPRPPWPSASHWVMTQSCLGKPPPRPTILAVTAAPKEQEVPCRDLPWTRSRC
jgi:bifunctional non-homologous end joining protein LigD